MKKLGFIFGILILCGVSYLFFSNEAEEPTRLPASEPSNYQALKACEKSDVLWAEILKTRHGELPELKKLGPYQVVKMANQVLGTKGNHTGDFSPKKWKKYLHAKGAVAKVAFVPTNSNAYTGLFKGFECGLLRLSLTYRPGGRSPVAPGLALKVLKDSSVSSNVSALVSLNGQDKDYDFFRHAMSNIVPVSDGIGQRWIHRIFKNISAYPEELLLEEWGKVLENGEAVRQARSPRQIFFVPASTLKFSSDPHDNREDFLTIPTESVVYKVFAAPEDMDAFNYAEEYTEEQIPMLLSQSVHIGDLVTKSEFVASEFGDSGLFFRHQFRLKGQK